MIIKRVRKIKYSAVTAIFFVVLFVISFLCGGVGYAYAASTSCSSVLADLQKDSSFNAADYPPNASDYSLQVIQIAESTAGELLIYVYQPSGSAANLRATTSRISQTTGNAIKPQDYKLNYLNANGVFYKYKVDGITVKSDTVRYYDITAIHRKYIDGVDEPTTDDNTTNETVFAVGQLWKAETADGKITYQMAKADYVEIKPEQKYVGFVRISNGWLPFLGTEKCDSHYVAFDCNYKIDALEEADVSYVVQKYSHKQAITDSTTPIGSPTSGKAYLTGKQKASNEVTGLFAKSYEWERIERASDFAENPNNGLSEEKKQIIKSKQWVLRFVETDYSKYNAGIGATITEYSEVSEVTILRLKFVSNGKTYNLGVVDNKQSGDLEPDNPNGGSGCNFLSVLPWWAWLLIVLFAPVLIVWVIKFLIWLFKKIIKRE